MMRQLVFHGLSDLTIEDAVTPPLSSQHVRVSVDAVGICKSDIYGYDGTNMRRQEAVDAAGAGLVMGHEPIGHISEVGDGVGSDLISSRVVVNPIISCGTCERCKAGLENVCLNRVVIGCTVDAPGAFADSLIVPVQNVVPFEGSAPIEWGAYVEPFAVGNHAAITAATDPGARVLVLGGGVIGTGAALSARRHGASNVLVLEPVAERRAIVEDLGLESAHPDEAETKGRFDVAIDCVARPETLTTALDAVPARGNVVLVGILEGALPLAVGEFVDTEKRLLGSYAYLPEEFAEVAQWLAAGEIDPSPIQQVNVGFEGIIEVFRRYADGTYNPMRTLFRPGGAASSDSSVAWFEQEH